jgi:Ca-activated chloride channel homolog
MYALIVLFLLGCPEAPEPPEDPLEDPTLVMAQPKPMKIKLPLPAGDLIVRNCSPERDMDPGNGAKPPPVSSTPVTVQPKPRPAPRTAPRPARPMKEREASAAPDDKVGDGSGFADLGIGGLEGAQGGSSGLGKGGDLGSVGSIAQPPREVEKKQESRKPLPQPQPRPKQVMDWGARIYLSNDDSMSLASAQRVLWAADKQRRSKVSEIRPHELLNYFSFDTDPVESGQMFSVKGSARHDGDQVQLALAVQGGSPGRAPLDLTLVVDQSCSMESDRRMDFTKRGLKEMTKSLKHGDRIDLVLFDDKVCTPIENWVQGRDNVKVLKDAIERITPDGATDLDSGLRQAYGLQATKADTEGRNRRVMVITDANLNTGNVDEDLVSEVGKHFEESGIRLTGVGVGRQFNDKILDMLTEKGKGAYVYLGSAAVVDRLFGSGFESLTRTVAHDVRFALQLPDSLAMERFYGEEASTNAEDVQPINYYANTSQVFLQDLATDPAKLKRSDPLKLEIEYTDAETGERQTQVWETTVGAVLDGDAHNLDKARALMSFSDILIAHAMRAPACTDALSTYKGRIATLGDDAEIGYVNGLVGGLCGVEVGPAPPEPEAGAVDFKVTVDSDDPLREVALTCGGLSVIEKLSSGDTVARFRVRPKTCSLNLAGDRDYTQNVTVPATGGSLRCVVRNGKASCI